MTVLEHSHTGRANWVHIALLSLLCLFTDFPGLDDHGVTNWQEGQRLVVARDMQARGDWLVPTVSGAPYLAKPPMIYWAQLALAGAIGDPVRLWHLRFVVALAGLLGVLATYFAARELLTPDRPTDVQRQFAARAALWSGALLATGILYVRAARIGELDILMVPFVAAAVWAVARAFRSHRVHRRTDWPAVLAATACTTGAVMTKDPGLLYVAMAAYGGIAIWIACTRDPLDLALLPRARHGPRVPAPATPRMIQVAGGMMGALAFFAAAARNIETAGDFLGAAVIALPGAWLGVMLARLAHPTRLMALLVVLSRTHPLLVIGVPAAARFGWAWAVAQRVGAEKAAALARAEVDDNIRLFIPEAPINNLETLTFGLGLGSIAGLIAIVVLVRMRPRITPGGAIIAGWIFLSLIAFSVLGKGVQRYLTPMWPAWAILGGWLVARWCTALPMRRPRALWFGAAVVVLAAGQSLQYGYLRERFNSARSPRDFVHAITLDDRFHGIDRLYSFEYTSPAMDYYAGRPVQVVGDPRAGVTMLAGHTQSLDRFADYIRHSRPAVIILRNGPIPGVDLPPAIDRLRAAGLTVEVMENLPAFRIDNGRTAMQAAKVSPAASR